MKRFSINLYIGGSRLWTWFEGTRAQAEHFGGQWQRQFAGSQFRILEFST